MQRTASDSQETMGPQENGIPETVIDFASVEPKDFTFPETLVDETVPADLEDISEISPTKPTRNLLDSQPNDIWCKRLCQLQLICAALDLGSPPPGSFTVTLL